jgi:hypothetical protein
MSGNWQVMSVLLPKVAYTGQWTGLAARNQGLQAKAAAAEKRCHRHQSDTCHKASNKRSRSSHFANSLSCVHEFEQRGLNAVPWR